MLTAFFVHNRNDFLQIRKGFQRLLIIRYFLIYGYLLINAIERWHIIYIPSCINY